jgi:peptide-methionine (S)-S-oxide reductase
VTFNPNVIDYETLLTAFFAIHDPTTPNRQGNDVGSQYRSVIFTHSADQEAVARGKIAALTAEGVWPDPIVTEVLPVAAFWAAEECHQDYLARNPTQPYCQAVASPKAAKLRRLFKDRLKT